ncbi:hypothetical protein EON83_26295 [bacterium]|nr:MAG: hypothetical protein EON83_26295 [bacterium]
MHQRDEELCRALFAGMPLSQFLREFRPKTARYAIIQTILTESIKNQDPLETECFLQVGARVGYCPEDIPLLALLLRQQWHICHEAIISHIGEFAATTLFSQQTLSALEWACNVRLDYLAHNNSDELARRAIATLWKSITPGSQKTLERLSLSPDKSRRDWAQNRLNNPKAFSF